MKYAIIILALASCFGCKDPRLTKVLSEVEVLQKSNDKLVQDLEREKQRAQAGQDRLASVCAEVDANLSKLSPSTHTVSERPIQIQELPVTLYKVDSDNGWAYLKYEVSGETRYSDRLWYREKKDRNSLLIEGSLLLSVENCTGAECTLSSRALSEIRDVCRQP